MQYQCQASNLMHHDNVSKAVTILILTNNKADVVSYSPLFTYDRSIHKHCVYHYHPSTSGTNHCSQLELRDKSSTFVAPPIII